MTPRTVVCMKWGSRYGSYYVNRLSSMVRRNSSEPVRLVCYTNNGDGIAPDVEVYPLLRINLPDSLSNTPWRRIALWAPRLPGASGTVLFLDLGVVITASLDDFFNYEPGRTCMIRRDPKMEPGGEMSVMRFEVGSASHLFEQMEREPITTTVRNGDPTAYVARESGLPIACWPDSWCASFNQMLMPPWPLNLVMSPRLPKETRLVIFSGDPQPHEARAGRWPAPWYEKIYKHVRATEWIDQHWR